MSMVDDGIMVSLGPFSVGIMTDDAHLSQQTIDFYRDFLTDQEPILTVRVDNLSGDAEIPLLPKVFPERIEFDQRGYQGVIDWQTKSASLIQAVKHPLMGLDYFLRVTTAVVAFYAGGLMLHAAAVEREGKAYLFLGYSGAGKTTTARNAPAGSVLNDDLVVLLRSDVGWIVWATPFHNPTQNRPRAGSAPIAKMLYLIKDIKVSLEPPLQGQALAEMVACVPVLTVEPSYLKEYLKRCQEILRCIPYYHLHLLPDDSYWSILLEE